MESILTSVKASLGIIEEYEHFDNQLIMCINTALMSLRQIGIGPTEGFAIKDKTAIWTDIVKDITKVEAMKTYVSLKTKLLFDPPLNSAVIEATNRAIAEIEWRLNVAAESNVGEEIQNGE